MALILSLKVLVISIGFVLTILGVTASVPLMLEHVPIMWSFLLLCFKPPYIYFLVNAIIICIAASSRFHHHHPSAADDAVVAAAKSSQGTEIIPSEIPVDDEPGDEPPVLEVKAVVVNGSEAIDDEDEDEDEEEEKGIDGGIESTWTPLNRMDSPELDYLLPPEKPLVSARFGRRRPPKAGPDGGKSLRVARAKRHETLENTWKAITEGRAMPLSRHVKKSDTWDHRGDVGPLEETTAVKKSETFKDRTSQTAVKLRKEPSLSQDELNRRVEAFIQKFNEDMRLQRQESWNQFLEMIDRGTD